MADVETDIGGGLVARARARGVRRMNTRREQIPFPEVSYGPWRRMIEEAADRIHAGVRWTSWWRRPTRTWPSPRPSSCTRGTGSPTSWTTATPGRWTSSPAPGCTRRTPGPRSGRRSSSPRRPRCGSSTSDRRVAPQEYPATAARIHVVANGCDADLAPEQAPEIPPDDRPLTFGYIGTVRPRCR